jgi:cytochrome c-type biogenesis protein CcmH
MKAPLVLLFCLLTLSSLAGEAQVNASDPELEARLLRLATDLRCVVCQNETLAESHAPLAQDLRSEVRGLLRQGRADAEVVAYLTDRYGDYVLYRPPFKPLTYLLWLGPPGFLLLAGWIWYRMVRRNQQNSTPPAPDDSL